MIMDDNLLFSDGQTLASVDFASTNVLDTEVALSNIGPGTPLWVVVKMNDKQTGTTAETIQVQLQDCTTSGGTYATIAAGKTFSGGEFTTAPTLFAQPIPANSRRYLRINYDVNASIQWTGTADAYIALNAPRSVIGVAI